MAEMTKDMNGAIGKFGNAAHVFVLRDDDGSGLMSQGV